MAGKRFRMTPSKSRKVFRQGTYVNKKNLKAIPMRGGFRL